MTGPEDGGECSLESIPDSAQTGIRGDSGVKRRLSTLLSTAAVDMLLAPGPLWIMEMVNKTFDLLHLSREE